MGLSQQNWVYLVKLWNILRCSLTSDRDVCIFLWSLTKSHVTQLSILTTWYFYHPKACERSNSNLVDQSGNKRQNLMHGIKLYHFGTAYKIGPLGVGFIGRLSIYPLGLRRVKLDLFYIRPCVHCTLRAHAPYCLQDLTCLSRMRDLPRLSVE